MSPRIDVDVIDSIDATDAKQAAISQGYSIGRLASNIKTHAIDIVSVSRLTKWQAGGA